VRVDQFHIDILVAHFVRRPQQFDVVVGSNLFGDILSDLGPACAGTIGIAPSANLNPDRKAPSLFEPVHGSAPDIAGRGIANPIGQIWSAAMMLDWLGHADAGGGGDGGDRKGACHGSRPCADHAGPGGKCLDRRSGRAIAAAV